MYFIAHYILFTFDHCIAGNTKLMHQYTVTYVGFCSCDQAYSKYSDVYSSMRLYFSEYTTTLDPASTSKVD